MVPRCEVSTQSHMLYWFSRVSIVDATVFRTEILQELFNEHIQLFSEGLCPEIDTFLWIILVALTMQAAVWCGTSLKSSTFVIKLLNFCDRSLEQAILVCKELGNFSDVPKLAHSACSLYQQHGSPESGATVLDKAAKLLESTEPEQALELFKRAADVVMVCKMKLWPTGRAKFLIYFELQGEDSPRQAAEYMSKAARILVKLKLYDQAADAIRREIGMHQQIDHTPSVGRLAVALVLVQLARGDQVAAEKAFKEWGNYCDAPEASW